MGSFLKSKSSPIETSTITPSARHSLSAHRTRSNRAVLTGPHELWHKQKYRRNRKYQRQISYTYIKEISEIHMNTIERMNISINNRIQCCIHINITHKTDKPEQESKRKKNWKVKFPCIIRNLWRCKLTSNSGDLNGAITVPGGSLMQPPNSRAVAGNVFPPLLVHIVEKY